MHHLAKKIAECLKAKVEGMGIDNISGEDLKEFGEWTDIIKDIACYDKDMRIIKAMDEADENDEIMKRLEMHEDYPDDGRMYYRGQPRSKTSGRYMSRGDGRRSRRGYEEMMMPDYDTDETEHMRDMDRQDMHRMYYAGGTGGNSSGNMSSSSLANSPMGNGNSGDGSMNRNSQNYGGNGRDSREGRSGQSRRTYMETKEMHKDNTPEAKQRNMKELENYTKELMEDVTEMVAGMSPEEKTMLRTKLQTLAQKVQ